jgi:hypothetical protein
MCCRVCLSLLLSCGFDLIKILGLFSYRSQKHLSCSCSPLFDSFQLHPMSVPALCAQEVDPFLSRLGNEQKADADIQN